MPHPDWILKATQGRTDWTIEELYRLACDTPSDINEHLPLLREYASRSDVVTEFGMRHGVSTIAMLNVCPRPWPWLTSYDLVASPMVNLLMRIDQGFSFVRGDTRSVTIQPTDLLFIDTLHTYAQLSAELRRHAAKVRRWIILHDTVTYGTTGEDGGPGLTPAITELVAAGEWRFREHRANNNGLTVLERVPASA